MMPRLDGVALLRSLRADARTEAVPVLLLSARTREEDVLGGFETGATDYLVKPFSSRELVARVRTHLGAGRARSAATESVRELAEQLRQAPKMEVIGRLAGGIAHDFNNMLSVILSYVEILLDDLPPDAPLLVDAEEIRTAGIRAADLDIGSFSRSADSRRSRPRGARSQHECVANVEKMLRRIPLGADVGVTSLLAAALGSVFVDPGADRADHPEPRRAGARRDAHRRSPHPRDRERRGGRSASARARRHAAGLVCGPRGDSTRAARLDDELPPAPSTPSPPTARKPAVPAAPAAPASARRARRARERPRPRPRPRDRQTMRGPPRGREPAGQGDDVPDLSPAGSRRHGPLRSAARKRRIHPREGDDPPRGGRRPSPGRRAGNPPAQWVPRSRYGQRGGSSPHLRATPDRDSHLLWRRSSSTGSNGRQLAERLVASRPEMKILFHVGLRGRHDTPTRHPRFGSRVSPEAAHAGAT